jgi:D-sedoheptulose 7-phosphate isomerase
MLFGRPLNSFVMAFLHRERSAAAGRIRRLLEFVSAGRRRSYRLLSWFYARIARRIGAQRLQPSESGGKMSFVATYLAETAQLVARLPGDTIEAMAQGLAATRDSGGRLFVLGVGGSASHASHAVNDFRKVCGFEAYAPTDNVSELTARTNDDGWETVFVAWLKGSRLGPKDAVLVFSVGGGSQARNISANLVRALEHAKKVGAKIYGVVGRDGGFTAQVGDAVAIVPPLFADRVTPHTEGLAAVVWHLLVSHPALKQTMTTWELRK